MGGILYKSGRQVNKKVAKKSETATMRPLYDNYIFEFMLKLLQILGLALLLPVSARAAVNVVVIAPQEGDYKRFGRELAEGVKIAARDINEHGGVLGQKINVLVADDRCDDTFAVSMAQMMSVNSSAEDKVNLVIGPYCGNRFNQTADIYAKAGILQIVPVPLGGEKTAVPAAPLKIAGMRFEQAGAFYDYYRHSFQGQNTALAYNADDRELVSIAAEIQGQFMRNGSGNRLTSYNFTNYGKDYNLMAREILLNSRLVYVLGASKETAKLTRALKEQRPDVLVFTDRYQLKDNYEEIAGSQVDGTYYLGLKNFKDSPYFTETLVNLRLQGMEPAGLGVYGFAALKLWSEVAAKAGAFDYKKMKEAASAGTFSMPWGEMSFRNGNFSGNALYGVFQRQGEEYTQVY